MAAPANLTAEQLQAIRGLTPWNNVYRDASGNVWRGIFNGGVGASDAGDGAGPELQYIGRDVVPGRNAIGDMQEVYRLDGSYLATGATKDSTKAQFMAGLAMMLPAFVAVGAGVASAGASGGAFVGPPATGAAYGSLVPGLEAYALPLTSAGGAVTASLGSITSPVLGLAKSIIPTLLSALGGGSGGAAGSPSLSSSFIPIDQTGATGIDPVWLLAGAAAVVFLLLESS